MVNHIGILHFDIITIFLRVKFTKINNMFRFEDGTVNFLSVIAVGHGLDTLRALAGPMRTVAVRTFGLAACLYGQMNGTRHGNGRPMFRTYADTTYGSEETQGGIVNFNVLRANGDYVGYNEVSPKKKKK